MPKMMTLECDHCHQAYERKASWVRHNDKRGRTSHFCSAKCRDAHGNMGYVDLTCGKCEKTFRRKLARIKDSKYGLQFCSHKCATEYTNSQRPALLQTCDICGLPYHCGHKTRCCPECISLGLHRSLAAMAARKIGSPEDLRPYGDRPIEELMGRKGPSRYRLIRDHAQRTVRERPQVCAVTGYSKHVHTAHIRPIPDFADHTPLKVVNDPRNLILLSPNAHTELDCGELEVDELPDAVAFREFEGEAIEAGYLVSA